MEVIWQLTQCFIRQPFWMEGLAKLLSPMTTWTVELCHLDRLWVPMLISRTIICCLLNLWTVLRWASMVPNHPQNKSPTCNNSSLYCLHWFRRASLPKSSTLGLNPTSALITVKLTLNSNQITMVFNQRHPLFQARAVSIFKLLQEVNHLLPL
jgi:hypothetical protein